MRHHSRHTTVLSSDCCISSRVAEATMHNHGCAPTDATCAYAGVPPSLFRLADHDASGHESTHRNNSMAVGTRRCPDPQLQLHHPGGAQPHSTSAFTTCALLPPGQPTRWRPPTHPIHHCGMVRMHHNTRPTATHH